MPEGDTIHNLATRLRPLLCGEQVTKLWVRERGAVAARVGDEITDIETKGKHLLVTLGEGWVLRVHLGMKGRVRRFAAETVSDHACFASTALIETARGAIGVFDAAQAELTPRRWLRAQRQLASLGPDLLCRHVDYDDVLNRARAPERAEWTLGELLLDQRVAAGIGNVYKSEILFMQGANPWQRVQDTSDASIKALFELGSELLHANLRPGSRRTVGHKTRPHAPLPGEDRLWVYGQTRRGCLKCHSPISSRRQGPQARTTYWCRNCQSDA